MPSQIKNFIVRKPFAQFLVTDPPTILSEEDLKNCDIPWHLSKGTIEQIGLCTDKPTEAEYQAEVQRLQAALQVAESEVDRLTADVEALKSEKAELSQKLETALSRSPLEGIAGNQTFEPDAGGAKYVTGDDTTNPLVPPAAEIPANPPRVAETVIDAQERLKQRMASMKPPTIPQPPRPIGPLPPPQKLSPPPPPMPTGVPQAPGIITTRPEGSE